MEGICGCHGRRLALACALALALVALIAPGRAAAGTHGPIKAAPADPGPDLYSPIGAVYGTTPLSYHGGAVMHTNKVYAIYWVPAGQSVSVGYRSIIDGFFQNVAADNGKTTNVYATSSEYGDGGGPAAYSSSFGGSAVDTQAFPASGCTNTNPATGSPFPVCLSDAQITAEIDRFAVAQNWPRNTSTLFFMFTPKNVGTCFSGGSSCFGTYFCAYHSAFANTHGTFIYANMPYDASAGGSCGAGGVPEPNGDDADLTLNVTSHEHMEAITDPTNGGWWDGSGYENGDKCAWYFGSPLGGSGSSAWNQSINGAHYELQLEWSNALNACTGVGATVPANTVLPALSGTATSGQTLTVSNGTWSGPATSYQYSWQRCSPTCAGIAGAYSSSYQLTASDVGATIKVLVWGVNGLGHGAATTAPTATVTAGPVPANTVVPTLTGAAGVGQTLTVANGTWTNSPTSYQYSWSRCPTMTTCAAIAGAYGTSYTLGSADLGTSIKVNVWAVNAAGHGSAWTTPTGTVSAAGLPANSTLPSLSGTAAVGQMLTLAPGSWSPAATSYSYAWARCTTVCSSIAGAFGSTYTVTVADRGARIKGLVWANNASGHGAAWTAPTATVP